MEVHLKKKFHMLGIVKASAFTVGALCAQLSAWEDHPDRDYHQDSDRVFRDVQTQTNSSAHENPPTRSQEKDGGNEENSSSYCPEFMGIPDRDE